MTTEDKEQKNDSQDNSSIIKLIYENANESVKFLRDDVGLINTRVTLLIGFNATFISLLSRLPNQATIRIDIQKTIGSISLNPQGSKVLEKFLSFVNWCLLIKPLVTVFLAISIMFAIGSLVPSPVPVVIFPKKMLEKSENCSEAAFREAVISNRDQTITELQKLINHKARKLKYALLTLGIASVLLAIAILIDAR